MFATSIKLEFKKHSQIDFKWHIALVGILQYIRIVTDITQIYTNIFLTRQSASILTSAVMCECNGLILFL